MTSPPAQGALRNPAANLDASELDELVDAVLGARPRPIDLSRLTATQVENHRRQLDAWVRWLVRRYGLDHRDIPPCWSRHGDLLEEHSALHTAHQSAYDPAGPATGPSDWHHTLADTRARLQLAVARTGCRPDHHRAPTTQAWIDEDR